LGAILIHQVKYGPCEGVGKDTGETPSSVAEGTRKVEAKSSSSAFILGQEGKPGGGVFCLGPQKKDGVPGRGVSLEMLTAGEKKILGCEAIGTKKGRLGRDRTL